MTSDFFSEFERDLREIAQREVSSRQRHGSKRVRLTPRRLAIVLAGVVLVGGAAAAATDLLPVGSKVPVRTIGGPHEPKRLGPRVVVATGRTPITGRWQMFASRSSDGDCVALQFLDERGPAAGSLWEGCGGPGGVTVGTRVPIPGTRRAETIIHGRTPDDVAAVRVAVPGLGTREVDVQPGPADVPGNWYLVAFAGVPREGTVKAEPLGRDGKALAAPAELEITLHPRYSPPSARYVGSERLTVSRGGLVPVTLACKRQPKREGKCIGTVSVKVPGSRMRCRPVAAGPICPDRGRRIGWQYYRLSPKTRRRIIHVRLSLATRTRVTAERAVRARLSIGGRKRDVVLIAP